MTTPRAYCRFTNRLLVQLLLVRGHRTRDVVTDKRTEKAYLELARTLYPAFPSGTFLESEAPDFVVASPSGPLGFEVTQLFQPPSATEFNPKQVESFRESVIRRAREIYAASGNPAVEVVAYFSDRPMARRRTEQLAQSFAEFVCANRPKDGRVLAFRESDRMSTLPAGFGSVSIAPSLSEHCRPWFAGGVGQTMPLTYDLLAQAISAKNSKFANYRSRASEVWLLVVADLFPSSTSFSVPADIETWHFDHEFDQVLLLSREESKVWALSPN